MVAFLETATNNSMMNFDLGTDPSYEMCPQVGLEPEIVQPQQ